MGNTIKLLSFIFVLFIFTGCQQQVQPPLYVWNNYVHSSTDYGMKGHEKEVLEKHIIELEKIILDSETKQQRVAPGIYAEYAQLLYETNKPSEAKKYFLLEKQTYPESSIFIDRVLKKLYGDES
jgi:hypothetical protein